MRLILHSADQLQMFADVTKMTSVLHLDATGSIIKKSEYVRKQLYLMSAVLDSPQKYIPALSLSDCLTEEVRMEDVEFWLRKIRCDISRLHSIRFNTMESAPSVIVMDFSWVFIHASLSVFCGTTIVPYLYFIYNKGLGNPDSFTPGCVIFACSSHFIARAARNMNRFFSNNERSQRNMMLRCIAGRLMS